MNGFSLFRFTVEGISPEEVIFKLKKEKIPLYHLQKREKNVLELCVERKYRKKVFTILENSCYNIKSIKKFGVSRVPDFLKRKAGALIGCLLFLLVCLLSDALVLRIDVRGGNYRQEALSILAECGVTAGKPYSADLTPELTARILALPEVTFCSIKKSGSVLRVEIERRIVLPGCEKGKNLYASRAGTIERLVVLRGRALVEAGTEAQVGTLLAEPGEDGVLMASVVLVCAYRGTVRADTQKEASAAVRFAVGEEAQMIDERFTPVADGFFVEATYRVTERVNM